MKIEKFIKETAIKLNLNEKQVEQVVKNQWRSANEALKTHSQVEISGIGYFETSIRRLRTKLEKETNFRNFYAELAKKEKSPSRIASLEFRVKKRDEDIETLNRKIKLHESRLARIDKRNLQQSVGEGVDKGDSSQEIQ